MADMDVFAAMGIAGFGKKAKQRQLDPKRFERNKRGDTGALASSAGAQVRSEDDPRPGPSSSSATPQPRPEEPEFDPDEVGPPPPPQGNGQDELEGEPEFDASEDESEEAQFPISHELLLKDHTKVVSALTMDPSGARVLSGSHDYDCKLWDFGGMDWRCKPFKTWEPAGSYYIHDLKYSNDGQQFLVVSGTTQAKLYDRDGEELATFVKGDQYIRDMKNTAIWDVENKRKQKTVIVVKSKERGARTKVNACAYSPDGSLIGGACMDGALHMWQTKSNFVRPSMTIEGAHTKGSETGSLVFSVDGQTVLTRGGDDTVKLWDLRSFKKPLLVRTGLATLYPGTNAIFSPDNKYIVTGASAISKAGKGHLLFMRKDTLETVKDLEVDSTPVKVYWHSKINQIVTGLSSGQICVLYSPDMSVNGAKLLLNKGPPRKATIEDMSDAVAAPTIITPHALPMFRDSEVGRSTKRKREKERMDPRKSRRPELPVTGPGRGGRVGASATQHVVQNLVRDTTRDEDPREALLKLAATADENPVWTAAWRANQPKPVFAAVEDGDKDDKKD
ncbi:transcription factor [Cerioporus squamosus]|nr:transcription factor [Cerioporus squamosus]